MKSSVDRDNNYYHYVIQRIASFAITLYYHPAECDVIMAVYRLLCGLLVFFLVCWVGSLCWWGRESSRRRVHIVISGASWLFPQHIHISLDDRWWFNHLYYYVQICLLMPYSSFRSSLANSISPAIVCCIAQLAILGRIMGGVLMQCFCHSDPSYPSHLGVQRSLTVLLHRSNTFSFVAHSPYCSLYLYHVSARVCASLSCVSLLLIESGRSVIEHHPGRF
jgi:hypothetical protein